MAPSLMSMRPLRAARTRSLEREELDARWGDRSISAPTYQKPSDEPIVPAEWASPATTLVDSSPELGFEKSISPVEYRGDRSLLTITIPLPWKRKSRARSASPRESMVSNRTTPQLSQDVFISPEDSKPTVIYDATKSQRSVQHLAAQMDNPPKHQQRTPVLSLKNVDLKSHMFPISPVRRESQPAPRNVDFLISELDAIALGQQVRALRDHNLTPVDSHSPVPTDDSIAQKTAKMDQHGSSVHALTAMVGHFRQGDGIQRPVSADDTKRRPPSVMAPVIVSKLVGHATVSVLTPVAEKHERNGQTYSNTTSIEASPSSPTAPGLTNSLAGIAITPVDAVFEAHTGYATNPTAALRSHPTSAAPRSRSASRLDNVRVTTRERAASQHRASSRNNSRTRDTSREAEAPVRRRSSIRRPPTALSALHQRYIYRRSSDLTTSRGVPEAITVDNPRLTVYKAYFGRRSMSAEPTPSRRHFDISANSPTTTVSSGSTEVDPVSDDDPVFSPKDPDRYFEERQLWNGVAGEGRKGFYANVVDDYRMIGRDVSSTNEIDNKRKTMTSKPAPEMTVEKIGSVVSEGRVKIAGLDPSVMQSGGQMLVPSSEELWG